MVDLFAFFDAHPPKAGGVFLVKNESNEFVSLDDSPLKLNQNAEPQEEDPIQDQKEEEEETKQDEQNEELENPYDAYYKQKEAEKLAKKGKKEGTFGIRQGVKKMKQDKCKQ